MKNKLYIFILISYIISLLFITYIQGRVAGICNISYPKALSQISNFIPFYRYSIRFFFIDFVEFMPLGYLLPKIFPDLKSKKTFIKTILCSIVIYKSLKTTLLLGYFDITNIIVSLFGAYIIFILAHKIKKS